MSAISHEVQFLRAPVFSQAAHQPQTAETLVSHMSVLNAAMSKIGQLEPLPLKCYTEIKEDEATEATEDNLRHLLEKAQRRERRMRALMDVNARLMTSLDYNELLRLIMNYAHDLLEVEATSVWTVDREQGTLSLQVATGSESEQAQTTTLPIGTGIVGEVVAHGKRQIVSDMQTVNRQGWPLEAHSGMVTRSVLCVPLSAPRIQLGAEQGAVDAEVIGAVQALNKRDGTPFSSEDILLFESFANQAATALQMARLYKGMQRQFRDTVTTIANLVDARDAYTHGHSQRVSDFAVAIGRELDLSPEKLYEIAIGGILHDVGKIGVSDTILNKQGKLTDEEFAQIKRHPTIGYTALQNSKALRTQLPGVLQAVLEHHKRLDGSGYPPSENDEPISLIGRIMAVADVFDALTSERTYRAAWSAESTLAYLQERAGTEFDAACVAALQRAYDKGHISTQMQRALGEGL